MRKVLIGIVLVSLMALSAFAITAKQFDFLNAGVMVDGEPATYMRIHFYTTDTTTYKTIWTDANKNNTAANPYTLDSNGRAALYGDGIYSLKVEVSTDGTTWTTQYTRDGIEAEVESTPSPLPVASGGSGETTAAGARTNLGVAIGSDVQSWDVDLDTLAASNLSQLAYNNSASAPGNTVSVNDAGNTFIANDLTVKEDLHVSINLTVSGDVSIDGDINVGTTANIVTCNVTGLFNADNQPTVILTSPTALASFTGSAVLTWNTTSRDTGNMWSAANPTIVSINVSGIYYVGAVVVLGGNDMDNLKGFYVQKNLWGGGTYNASNTLFYRVWTSYDDGAADATKSMSGSVVAYLKAGDFLNCILYSGNSAAVVNNDFTRFMVTKLH